MRKALKFAVLAVVTGCAVSGLAVGQMADPTRPPGGMATGPSTGLDGTGTDAVIGVQAIFIRPGGKSSALVNGQMLQVGDKLADKKVINITESEIVLRSESGRETMKLIPDVTKTPHKSAAIRLPVNSAGRKSQ